MKNYLLFSLILCFCLKLEVSLAKQDVSFVTTDGVTIVGSYYQPTSSLAPSVILLPMLSRTRSSWDDFAEFMLKNGFAVLSIDLRGHGESIRSQNGNLNFNKFDKLAFQQMTLDVKAAVNWLKLHSEIDSNQISIVGAAIGSNVALCYAVTDTTLDKLVLLSPGLDYRGVQTESAMRICKNRSMMMVAAEDDSYSAVTVKTLANFSESHLLTEILEKGGHGTYLLDSQADLDDKILSFLRAGKN